MRRKTPISGFCLSLCIAILLVGCDQSFQPLQENDQYYFSIFGYLDAAADTQWVRVGTVRQNINETPDPKRIQVTLENINSGKTVVMKDSLFNAKGFLNYWTTMDIKNEQTYRITVVRADGKASWVTVTTSQKLPLPYIFTSGPPDGAYIIVDETVEHIADVQSVWYVILNPGTENHRRIYRFPLRNTLRYTTAFFGGYSAFANWEEEREQIEQSIGGAEMVVASRQFFVAAGGPEWNDSLSSVDNLEYFLDGTASNVENGLGYVVGIDAQWFRQITCLTPDSSGFAPCTPEDGPFWY